MNDLYKLRHKPILHSDKLKFKQSYYYPVNPEKCLTKINICRSLWESLFCRWCDFNPNILYWASEPLAIPYLNPVANMKYCMELGLDPLNPSNWKRCNYYTDFWIEMKDSETGETKKIFIEVKPYSQTLLPSPLNESASLKEHKAYNKAAETYLVNQAKWTAAQQYCNERGASFMVVTERTLQKLGLM